MKTGQETTYNEKDDGFELTMFNVEDEESFNPGENFKEDDDASKEEIKSTKEKEEESKDASTDSADNDSDDDTQDDNLDDTQENSEDAKIETEEDEVSIDKVMAKLLEEGKLMLPEDYEYEDTTEGLTKAFEDSENYRNQLAFQEAVNFLTSKEGLDLVKVKASVNKIDSYENLDVTKMSEDDKLDVIKEFYKAKDYTDTELEDIIEDLIGNDSKIEKELTIATKYLTKEEKKIVQKEIEVAENKRKEEEESFKQSQELLKNKLKSSSDFNGYVITEGNKDRNFSAIYKPIKLPDGTVTTEVNQRLSKVLNNPDSFLVLTDLLMNMKGDNFDFSSMIKKEETKATEKVKKSIRDFKNSNNKSKVSGKNSQTQNDFDLSRAAMSFG